MVLQNTKFAIITVLLALSLLGCGDDDGFTGPISGTGEASLDAVVIRYLSREGVPGVAAAIASGGRLVFARGYGYADLARREPLQPDHLFRVASVSKPITGISVLEAAEEGLLALDARVVDLLPSLLPPGGPADPRVADMTVAHLLHHTAGWTQVDYPADPLFRSKEIAAAVGVTSPPDGAAIVRWIFTQPLGFAPGSDFTYTNVGFVVLSRIIEAASGVAYEDFVRSRVLAPAGVSRARLAGLRRSERLEGEVEYQSRRLDIWTSIFEGESGVVPEPAYGGLNLLGLDGSSAWVLSAVDLARLGVAVDGDPTGPDLLTAGTRQLMLTNGSPAGRPAHGVGWFLASAADAAGAGFPALAFADHSGGMPGTNAYLFLREDGLVIAIVVNADRGAFIDSLVIPFLRALVRIEGWPNHDLFDRFR